MQIYKEPNKNPNLSLALGFFDGVHTGHQAVIKNAVNYANKTGNKSAVITFIDHPCCYLWNVKPKYILTRKMREEKIKELGVDFLYEIDFKDVAALNANDYLKNILIDNFSPVAIATGWNHNFGSNKSGSATFLNKNSSKYGYKYFEIPPQKKDSEIISSTKIRELLSNGIIDKANIMLGYNFSVSGEVIQGNKIGRIIGYKTANIKYPDELIELPYGVYHVKTNFGKGVANFGIRPTINGSKPILEVHILDFDDDIYRKNINIQFIKKLRSEKKFDSIEELKNQIKIDIKSI